MREIFQHIKRCLNAGQDLVLATVIASTGSTPRSSGARMLIGKGGRICGTVGGGSAEYESEQFARTLLAQQTHGQQDFAMTSTDAEQSGMICGGSLSVYFHYIPAGDAYTRTLADKAEAYYAADTALWLFQRFGGPLSLYTKADGFIGEPCPDILLEKLPRMSKTAEAAGSTYHFEQINDPGKVYIFGCGHVGQQLEPVLTRVGFRCIVLDDRPDFADPALFPTAEAVKCIDFAKIDEAVSIGPEDYVCVTTRGHMYDLIVQAQVLPKHPCYVGVVGSRRKAAAVGKALMENHGITPEELALVTTPVGLEIAAETPAEIAVSIAAQMIARRAARRRG